MGTHDAITPGVVAQRRLRFIRLFPRQPTLPTMWSRIPKLLEMNRARQIEDDRAGRVSARCDCRRSIATVTAIECDERRLAV
jgi:hypothetical protein